MLQNCFVSLVLSLPDEYLYIAAAAHLCVLLVHLLPAGLREELCAAARQTVWVQVKLRVRH